VIDGRPDEARHLGDEIAGLVLGDIEGERRAAMAAHLLQCASCRHEYDELSATVEELLPAVPAVQPPIGFDQRVLGRLGTLSGRRARRRRWWLAGAAATLVAVAAGAAGWFAATGTDTAGGEVAALELTETGTPVGTVSISDVEGDTVMVVAVVDAPEDVSYMCRTTLDDGTVVEAEPWQPGAGAWLVPLPYSEPDDVALVELLVDGTDQVWSTASFDA
jgi:hypothetical protein